MRKGVWVAVWILISVRIWAANPGDVVINELMWMGDSGSVSSEWIELRNMTDFEVNLSGWRLTKKSSGEESEMLTIPEGKSVAANGYFLISNYDATNSKLNIEPDLVNTRVELSNTDLQVKLYDASNTLIDTADDGGEPAAGINGTPSNGFVDRSMMRVNPPGDGTLASNWFTADKRQNWDADSTEWGTPRATNLSDPTWVRLIDLSAVRTNDGVLISWSGVSEANLIGWRIYRQSDGEHAEMVTESIIPSGDQQYEFLDTAADRNENYIYRIEGIDLSGRPSFSQSARIVERSSVKPISKLTAIWADMKR